MEAEVDGNACERLDSEEPYEVVLRLLAVHSFRTPLSGQVIEFAGKHRLQQKDYTMGAKLGGFALDEGKIGARRC